VPVFSLGRTRSHPSYDWQKKRSHRPNTFRHYSLEREAHEGTRWDAEIAAITNPIDSNNLIAFAMNSLGATLYSTTDLGNSWQSTLIEYAGDPVLAADRQGTIYAAYIGEPHNIYYRYSTDKGITWLKPTDDVISKGTLESDKPWLAVDRSQSNFQGSLYAAIVVTENNQQYIILKYKRATDKSFSNNTIHVSNSSFASVHLPCIDVDNSGKLHLVFWGQKASQEKSGLWYATSSDGGNTFSQPKEIAILAGALEDVVPNDTRGDIQKQRSCFGTINPQFAIDRSSSANGNIYLTWTDSREVRPFQYASDIYLIRSSNSGKSWSGPTKVNPFVDSISRFHFLASPTIDRSGVLSVSWYEGDDEKNSTVNIAVSHSFDGGVTFTPRQTATSSSMDLRKTSRAFKFGFGHYTQTVSTSNYTIPFWSDGRDSTRLSLFCALVPITDAPLNHVTRLAVKRYSLQVFPNPIQLGAPISISCSKDRHTVTLSDILGNILLQQSFYGSNCTIAHHNLQRGTYYVTLSTEGTTTLQHSSFIVQ